MNRWTKPVGLICCTLLFFTLTFQLGSDAMQSFDQSVTQALVALRTPALTEILTVCSQMCSPVVLLCICLLLMFAFRRKHYSIPIAFNLVVAVFLNFGLKTYFLRDRPPAGLRLVVETGYSFPSGHAMAALAFYGFLIYIACNIGLSRKRRWLVCGALSLLIALIGFSRVYLAAHYLTDVIAGFAVATAYLIVYTTVVGRYIAAGRQEALEPCPVNKNRSIRFSFLHAFEGVASGVKGERNMLIHFAAMAFVTVFGFLFSINEYEWLVCIVLFGLMIGAELFNTAIEAVVDICMPHIDPRAKFAKDVSAGAVCVIALAATAAGLLIFVPKILARLPQLG